MDARVQTLNTSPRRSALTADLLRAKEKMRSIFKNARARISDTVSDAAESSYTIDTASLARWFFTMRVTAVVLLAAGGIVFWTLGVAVPNPRLLIFIAVAAPVYLAAQTIGIIFARKRALPLLFLKAQLVIDLMLLTALLYLSDAAYSHAAFFYLFTIMSAALISLDAVIASVVVASLSYALLISLRHTLFAAGALTPRLAAFSGYEILDISIFVAVIILAAVHSLYYVIHVKRKGRQLAALRDEFVAATAHQVKSPLAAEQLLLEILLSAKNGSLTAEQKNIVAQAMQVNKNLNELVHELIGISRMDGDLNISKIQEVNINSLVENILQEVRFLAAPQNIKIIFPRRGNILVHASPPLLRQILQNIIANAITYSKKGGRIRVELTEFDERVLFMCEDGGIGIPKEEHGKIFSPFFRASNSSVKKKEGTGLGLYIVKRIADNFRYKVWFDSEKNKGTVFWVMLPKQIA